MNQVTCRQPAADHPIFQAEVSDRVFDIKALVFDKDGLLTSSQALWKELARSRNREFSKFMHPETLRKLNTSFQVELDEKMEPVYTDPTGVLALVPQVEEEAICTLILHENEGLLWPDARKLIQQAFLDANRNFDYEASTIAEEGFPDIFIRAAAAGIPITIATQDTQPRTEWLLKKYGVENLVSLIISPESVSSAKPAPDMLLLIAEKMNIEPRYLMMIGDSFLDTQMAQAAGSVGIGVTQSSEMRKLMESSALAITGSLNGISFPV